MRRIVKKAICVNRQKEEKEKKKGRSLLGACMFARCLHGLTCSGGSAARTPRGPAASSRKSGCPASRPACPGRLSPGLPGPLRAPPCSTEATRTVWGRFVVTAVEGEGVPPPGTGEPQRGFLSSSSCDEAPDQKPAGRLRHAGGFR